MLNWRYVFERDIVTHGISKPEKDLELVKHNVEGLLLKLTHRAITSFVRPLTKEREDC